MANEQSAARVLGVILNGFPTLGNREGLRDFSRLALEVLARYPDSVLNALGNPVSGILASARYLPTIAELKAFCEAESGRQTAARIDEDAEDRRRAYLPPPPPDPTNKYADDPRAAEFGHRLFFDRRLSSNGKVACATCHKPELGFTDGKKLAQGVGTTDRNAPTVVGAAYNNWFGSGTHHDDLERVLAGHQGAQVGAVLARPVVGQPAPLVEQGVPGFMVGLAQVLAFVHLLLEFGGHRVAQEGPHLIAEGEFFGAIVEIHGASFKCGEA